MSTNVKDGSGAIIFAAASAIFVAILFILGILFLIIGFNIAAGIVIWQTSLPDALKWFVGLAVIYMDVNAIGQLVKSLANRKN